MFDCDRQSQHPASHQSILEKLRDIHEIILQLHNLQVLHTEIAQACKKEVTQHDELIFYESICSFGQGVCKTTQKQFSLQAA